uniref:RAB, member of RAS oncogene family like 2A n=1 Tax=Callorhinchus milii TaxID=7868 RepID=A0A4W3GUC2_CALMI
MAGESRRLPELNQDKYDTDEQVKIICLGDSAVGKSKLMERFLVDGYRPQQLSTYALTLYKHSTTLNDKTVLVVSISLSVYLSLSVSLYFSIALCLSYR